MSEWKVQVKKDRSMHETSVVREDNKHGQQSWGWGGDDKIIIKASEEFALRCAQILCDGLNAEPPKES